DAGGPVIHRHGLAERAGDSLRYQARNEIVAAAGLRRDDPDRLGRIGLGSGGAGNGRRENKKNRQDSPNAPRESRTHVSSAVYARFDIFQYGSSPLDFMICTTAGSRRYLSNAQAACGSL